jgi:fructuronate reductase
VSASSGSSSAPDLDLAGNAAAVRGGAGVRLSRTLPDAPAAAPVRIVHLGVGNFHRAHQAWYTAHSPGAENWGIAAFTGRRADMAEALAPQDGLYTLITRSADGDSFELIGALSAVHSATEHEAYLDYLSRPEVALVTITVTEAGYLRDADGHLDVNQEVVGSDAEALRAQPRSPVSSLPGKLVAGLLSRRAAGAGPITILSCDNLPENGLVAQTVARDLAALVDPSLLEWIAANVDFATSMVDRITPATTDEDRRIVEEACGYEDAYPVPTEPFSEWVMSGTFPAGRPRWEDAGASIVDDVGPFEQRKLRLLNGSHSLLAYAGSIRGHETIDEAIGDAACRRWVELFWDESGRHLELPTEAVAGYRTALLERFSNPRVRHRLSQIATDGSTKLAIRAIPTIQAERAAGRLPTGCATVVAAWVLHLRGLGAPVQDAAAGPAREAANAGDLSKAVPAVLETLAPGLGEDSAFCAEVLAQAEAIQA